MSWSFWIVRVTKMHGAFSPLTVTRGVSRVIQRCFRQGEVDRALIDRGADKLFRLDVTDMPANEAAASILEWLQTQ